MSANKIWFVVEYMAGSIKQTLVLATTAKEAGQGFTQVLRVVKLH